MTFFEQVLMSFPIGSRYVCDPPVLDTDRDTLFLVNDIPKAEAALLAEGWTPCLNGEYFEVAFKAFRKGIDNYVITAQQHFFDRYVLAAQVAKALNLQNKEDRIKVHETLINAVGAYFGFYEWDRPDKIIFDWGVKSA